MFTFLEEFFNYAFRNKISDILMFIMLRSYLNRYELLLILNFRVKNLTQSKPCMYDL